ncbi:MAG: serine/threonine protein kinase [Candidatus Methanofastidiosia archaeon]|jgi:putative serine/threonine protein kinase
MATIYDVLTYPERKRDASLEEKLDCAGVELIPKGKKEVYGVPVLGKGWSSIVVYGVHHGAEVAVKIQRKDSPRRSLQREAFFLNMTNKYQIGPRLYYAGDSFLVLEYIHGTPIREADIEKEHIIAFLGQCHTLDMLTIDHGQIQGGKHLLVGDKKCWIIDFEKAGYRTCQNVSSLMSELFLKKTQCAYRLRSQFGINKKDLITAVHNYKHGFNIKEILKVLE